MRTLILVLAAALPLACSAGDSPLEKLQAERAGVLNEMASARAAAIKSDSELRKLNSRIMDLQRELAIRLDSKPELRTLNDRLMKLDSGIEDLQNRTNTPGKK